MIEPEIAFADLEDDMNLAESMLKYIINYVMENAPEEMNFFNSENPKLALLVRQLNEALLACPYRAELEKEYGELYFRNMEVQKQFADERIVEDQIRESKLTQKYSKVSATASISFRGEECNFYGLLKHMQSTDRELRRDAFQAWAELYSRIAPELDAIYDELVQLRDGMAKKLGYDKFTPLGYLRMRRNCYTEADVEKFRIAVQQYLVPVAKKLYMKQAQRQGREFPLNFADKDLAFRSGNPKPVGTPEEIAKLDASYEHLCKMRDELVTLNIVPAISEWSSINPNL